MGNNEEINTEAAAQAAKDEKDMQAFTDGLTALIKKTGVTVLPQIKVTPEGVQPVLKLARMAPQPEAVEPSATPATPVTPKKNGKKSK